MGETVTICGHERTSENGILWRCIKNPHNDDESLPHPNDIAPAAPNRDRHYYVRVREVIE